VPLAPDVNLKTIARGTPGFSGADLANLINEAALNAVRAERKGITPEDLDAARERVLLGAHDGTTALLPEERNRVAVHESGHALVAALSPHADPVDRITILPTGAALGRTEQLPVVERHLYGEAYLDDTLAVRLGGRVAERIVLHDLRSGAANDLEEATALATRMVLQFGLSEALGPVSYPEGMPLAPATQALVDREVRRLVQRAEERATALLEGHTAVLQRLVRRLEDQETLDGSAVTELLAVELPSAVGTG
jgi:cell division protease FtsH